MKKFIALALIAILSLGLLAGCRSRRVETTTVPTTVPAPVTTAPTTRPTTMPTTEPTTHDTMEPGTDDMMPDMDDMIPGPEDTIDPTNGANETTDHVRSRRNYGY